jgi:hypothetical protein
LNGRAETPQRPIHPGERQGIASAGAAIAEVNAKYFSDLLSAFNEVYSIAGDLESGVGLGSRFNGSQKIQIRDLRYGCYELSQSTDTARVSARPGSDVGPRRQIFRA